MSRGYAAGSTCAVSEPVVVKYYYYYYYIFKILLNILCTSVNGVLYFKNSGVQ